jgi:hypothetical protein
VTRARVRLHLNLSGRQVQPPDRVCKQRVNVNVNVDELEPGRQPCPTLAAATMESYNLKTASTYINNLLLARGLLRDGKPIEFAHPSRAEGGKEATMAQVINLVHDLLLKRDVRHILPAAL